MVVAVVYGNNIIMSARYLVATNCYSNSFNSNSSRRHTFVVSDPKHVLQDTNSEMFFYFFFLFSYFLFIYFYLFIFIYFIFIYFILFILFYYFSPGHFRFVGAGLSEN